MRKGYPSQDENAIFHPLISSYIEQEITDLATQNKSTRNWANINMFGDFGVLQRDFCEKIMWIIPHMFILEHPFRNLVVPPTIMVQ